ncbi:MAG: TonB-dependent receptor [Flavobacteriales bacterium]
MIKKIAFSAMVVCAGKNSFAQIQNSNDTIGSSLQEITIVSTKADSKTPVTFSEISEEQISKINYGQDMPYILRSVPSLVMTSDGGTGIGYTGLWIRGSDPSRINVTINDIPLNDPESQQVFWVNLPDFATTTDDIQVQRGVGTSTNGTASFGGTIKLTTTKIKTQPYLKLLNGGGSFNTLRNAVGFGTGLKNNKFILEGRLSRISSDGYIDRASARMSSVFLNGTYLANKTTIKATFFSGQERTYQSWYGTPISRLLNNTDSMLNYAANNGLSEEEIQNLLNSGRTYNYYTYPNQVDDYRQTHYQLHFSRPLGKGLYATAAGHYTAGQGFFEEYKADQSYESYGLIAPNDSISSTDLIRRRWLKNEFYGAIFSINYKKQNLDISLGGAANQYVGEHFGEIAWMQFAGDYPKDSRYYQGNSTKNDGNVYLRAYYTLKNRWVFYGDMQVRNVQYKTKGIDNDLRGYDVNDNLVFFNPKAGVQYKLSNNKVIYASAAVGNKEPNRNDYVDAIAGYTPKPESMIDFEAGYKFSNEKIILNANLYYMDYNNQLVLTGELNDVGAPLRVNVDKSYRRGVETELQYQFNKKWNIQLNASASQNKIEAFKEVLYDYTTDFEIIEIEHKNTDIAFSPSIIAGGRIDYNIWKGLSLSWLSRFVSKQYLDNTSSEYLTINPYIVNDIAISYSIQTKQKNRILIQGMLNNAFNELYSSNGYTYSYIYGSRITEKFLYPQAGRQFLIIFDIII